LPSISAMSPGFSPWRNRSTKARISIAVSTRRRRRDRVEGLGNRPGRRLVVDQCRGLQAHFTDRSCRAAQQKTRTMMWGWKLTSMRRKVCPTSMIR
jgi:hypothetical protein